MNVEELARDLVLDIVVDKMKRNPAVMAAGEQGHRTAKEFLPWATDEQLGDVWKMIADMTEAVTQVADMDKDALAETVEAVNAGAVVSSGYSYAKAKGLL